MCDQDRGIINTIIPINTSTSGKIICYEETAKRIIGEAISDTNAYLEGCVSLALSQADRAVPYKFGGKSVFGMDCSGLTQHCYENYLPAGIYNQYVSLVSWMSSLDEIYNAEPGDLVFFRRNTDEQPVSHGGIVVAVVGNYVEIVHASVLNNCVRCECWNNSSSVFCNAYVCVGSASMRPFMLRNIIDEKITNEVKLAR